MEEQKNQPALENDPEMEAKLPPEALAQLPNESQQDELPAHVANQALPQTEKWILPPKKNYKPVIILLVLVLILAAAAVAFWLTKAKVNKTGLNSNQPTSSAKTTVPVANTQGLQLIAGKNYGDKYSNGLLPIGDGKYVTDGVKVGYVYACSGYASNLKNSQGGAGSRGPWFANNNTEYDINKKLHVAGSVAWQGSFSNNVAGSLRSISTNDLPNHTSGVFPISTSDPAYAFDRNPNSIKAQTLSYSLNASPSYGTPNCMGGEVGVMLSGVALFNGFDAGGRDAGAWEIQDSCSGHPQKDGEYHYHTLSSCIKDTSVQTVIGFALDGYPITGPKVGDKNILTTSDLDECHGISSQIVLDTKTVSSYHYVMTQDFPYSVSCFRSKAANPPYQPAQAPLPH